MNEREKIRKEILDIKVELGDSPEEIKQKKEKLNKLANRLVNEVRKEINEDFDNGIGIGIHETLSWILNEVTVKFLERDIEVKKIGGLDYQIRHDELVVICKRLQELIVSEEFKTRILKDVIK